MNTARIISGPAELAEGTAWLVRREPRFADALERTGPWPLRLKPAGFAGLLDIIISQQVSVASASAIRARMQAAGLFTEDAVIDAGQERLRAAGLSRPKARYAAALAQARLDYRALEGLDNAQAIQTLCAQLGIGPWSAQIYVMFCMGRADVFAPGDLALQEAAKVLFDLEGRPTADALEVLAQNWSPWRSVAARALFAYYRVIKMREGLG